MKFIVLRVNYGGRPVQDPVIHVHPHAVFRRIGVFVLMLVYVYYNKSVFPAGAVHVKPIPKHITERLEVL